MKTHEMEFDTFDTALSDLLQGSEMPSGDFTVRIMAQVAQTPQEQTKAVRRPTSRKTLATLAACAAVVVLCAPFLRLMFGGMGAMKAADSAAPADAPAEAAEDIYMYQNQYAESAAGGARDGEAPAEPTAPAPQEMEKLTEPAALTEQEPNDNSGTFVPGSTEGFAEPQYLLEVILERDVFEEVSAWLLEQGYPYEDGYTLAAADMVLLNEQFPKLELPEVDCILQAG